MKDLRILAGLCILIASVSASAQTTESVSTDAVVVSDTLTTVPIVPLSPTSTKTDTGKSVFLPPTILAEDVVNTVKPASEPAEALPEPVERVSPAFMALSTARARPSESSILCLCRPSMEARPTMDR